jgi:hypothetical protein
VRRKTPEEVVIRDGFDLYYVNYRHDYIDLKLYETPGQKKKRVSTFNTTYVGCLTIQIPDELNAMA